MTPAPLSRAPGEKGGAAHGEFREDKVVLRRDRDGARIGCEATGGGRPDVDRRRGAELRVVDPKRAFVALVVADGLADAAVREAVMEFTAQHFAAEMVPVGTGRAEMQMPGLVDRDGRRDRFAGDGGEMDEAQVFRHHALGVDGGPTVFAREPGGEAGSHMGGKPVPPLCTRAARRQKRKLLLTWKTALTMA